MRGRPPNPNKTIDLYPPSWRCLGARYQRHESPLARLLNTLSCSAMQRKMNRTIHDPVFLATELERWSLQKAQDVSMFFRRYAHIGKLNSRVRLEGYVHQVVSKLLQPAKVSEGARQLLNTLMPSLEPDQFPLTCLNVPQLCIGVLLYEAVCASPIMQSLVTQSAGGQLLALQCVSKDLKRRNHRLGREEAAAMTVTRFQDLCVAAGIFSNFRFYVGAHAGLSDCALQRMEEQFLDLGSPARPSNASAVHTHPTGTRSVSHAACNPGHVCVPRTRRNFGRVSTIWQKSWASHRMATSSRSPRCSGATSTKWPNWCMRQRSLWPRSP